MQEATAAAQEAIPAVLNVTPIAGNVVTAVASVLGSIITAVVAVRSMNKNAEVTIKNIEASNVREMVKLSLDVTMKQVSELYGPMLLLVRQNEIIADQLRDGIEDKEGWRLLDHIDEVLADPQKKGLVDEILAVDKKMEEVITTKGGYCEDLELQRLFADFLGHYRILMVASKGGANIPQGLLRYYPRSMNARVARLFEEKTAEIDRLRESAVRLMARQRAA